MDKYYQILGISPNASEEEIKRQYRKLALEHHPDTGGDPEKFKEIKEAYEIITGKARPPRDAQPAWEPIDPNNFGFGFGFDFSNFQQEESLPTEENAVLTMNIPIKDIINGINYSISYNVAENCEKCNGVGGESVNQCSKCKGLGQMGYRKGNMVFTTGCNDCRGRGKIIKNACQKCSGNGKIMVSKPLNFEVRKKQ